MITDFNDYPDGHSFEADVCVIGAGAAGITIAREFVGSRYSVVLLEGGGAKAEPSSQSLYDTEVTGLPHTGVHTGRARIFGGATTLWAGQTLPLDELDFEERSWVPYSGWPIKRAELQPFYRRAEQVLNLEEIAYDASRWPYGTPPPPAYDPSKFRPLISQFSPKQNFAEAYRKLLHEAANITVVLHANAASLRASGEAQTVELGEIRSLSGKKGWAKAREYIVCCGGIDTARLLLASDDVQPGGLGNARDLVGRFFQDHIQVQTAPVQERATDILRTLYQPFYWRGVAYVSKAAVSEQMQQRHGILNATAGATYESFTQKDSPVESAKRLIRGLLRNQWDFPVRQNLQQVLSRPDDVAKAAYRRLVLKQPAFRMEGDSYIGLQCECDPNPDSRVTLSTELDAIGMRKSRLNWQRSALVQRTISIVVRTIAEEFARLGIAETTPEDLARVEEGMETRIFDANHHMGTTRMGDSPNTGVVDLHCRVHGIDNLFVSSSSVFCTGGHSNPTFTILALALRLADHLKGRLSPA